MLTTAEYSIVTYVPGDQHSLDIFSKNGWQVADQPQESTRP